MFSSWLSVSGLTWALLASRIHATSLLTNNGFTSCLDDSIIKVDKLDLTFNKDTGKFNFDVAGTCKESQKVMASLSIEAYGQHFTHDFSPCDENIDALCPIPEGNFAANDELPIPPELVSKIPSIAFSVPNLEAFATLKLKTEDDDKEVACLRSSVGNNKSIESPAVSYVAAGIAAGALVVSGAAALAAGGQPGAPPSSPSFGEVVGWFQSMAMNGMLSVNYPPIYRSFTSNFAFSTGVVPWAQLQRALDDFRSRTGGNLTEKNYDFLKNNATFIHAEDQATSGGPAKRALDAMVRVAALATRDEGNSTEADDGSGGKVNHVVEGIQGFFEPLLVPDANTFMTVLMIFAIVVAAIALGILLLKVILELWALRGSFPKKLANFRKHYWGILARTITNLILILYGIWTLYCVYQFTHGESWAPKLLAAVTLALFTGVLGFFTWKIWSTARRYKKIDGSTEALFEDKETWRKYSLFYDHYKKSYWWIFVPLIVYLFARGCIIAGGDGHGLVQSGGQLIVESILLLLLVWARPYETKTGQWINISIQVVRVLSVACILVFVHELGVSQTTKTVTGIVLIAVQSTLTAILAILIAINAIILCCGKNPHKKRREANDKEKLDRDMDNLTPLDARNSLLEPRREPSDDVGRFNALSSYGPYRDVPHPTKKPGHAHTESTDNLLTGRPRHEREDTSYSHHVDRDSGSRSVSPEGRYPLQPMQHRPF